MQRLWISSLEQAPQSKVFSVLGPTGSGKTAAVVGFVAKHFKNPRHPLLVSVDAVTIYRELNKGSAKPQGSEREIYDWAGLDCLDPPEDASVSRFLQEVQPTIQAALAQNRPVILVGGSHFYERALVDGLSPGTASSPEFVQGLSGVTNELLHQRLALLDPLIAERLHVNDRYRLERYLDLVERQGLSYAELFANDKKNGLGKYGIESLACVALGMSIDRNAFEAALSARIGQMLADGWIAETQLLLTKYGAEARALQSVGYHEILQYLGGALPKSELNEQILIAHRQLAKKQRTWIRGLRAKSEAAPG